MQNALIKLACRQIIDSTSEGSFERNALQASYNEFILKSQAYNPGKKFTTFKEMVANDGRANSLHYKSGFAIAHFIENLNKKIPHIEDALGKEVAFETYEFRVIDFDITNLSTHKVAITYTTGILTLYGNINEFLLLATGDKLNEPATEPAETFILKMQPNLSIVSFQPV